MIRIRNLSEISTGELYSAFKQAFADYPVRIAEQQFCMMIKRRGFDPDLSFGAFDNNRLVAFTLNGIGNFTGLRTAYDTGTGTIKEYRGQGLATGIFEHALPFLRDAGIKQYLLEVLQENTKAVSVYQKLGFKVTREFAFSVPEIVALKLDKTMTPGYLIKEADFKEVVAKESFFDFVPSWQNSYDSIRRNLEEFRIFGAYFYGSLVGFCITEFKSGDISLLAVDRQHRRRGVATELLNRVCGNIESPVLKFINSETTCPSVKDFLFSIRAIPEGKQFEMLRQV